MALQVRCIDVVKRFGSKTVVDHVNLEVPAGETVGLLGASGAGKTTLLRLIAGLEPCSSGQILLSAPERPNKRTNGPIGMVFQNLALWPHLSVRKHLECVLPSWPRSARRSKAEALLSETRVPAETWDRLPSELSGGEKQRLALARALAQEPELLLLDEPLAHVDTELRAELLDQLHRLLRTRSVTTIYVTHSAAEVFQVCQRIAVLKNGRLVQEGTPGQVFWHPANLGIARLSGPVTVVPRRLIQDACIAADSGNQEESNGASEQAESLAVRPQQLSWIAPDGKNRWVVKECAVQGAGWVVSLERENFRLSVPSTKPLALEQTVGIELKLTVPATLLPSGVNVTNKFPEASE